MSVTAEYINEKLAFPFNLIMDSEGVTAEYLAKKLKEELEATKVETFKASTKEFDDGKLVTQHEEIIYSKPLVDWKTRQEARKDAHKLRNDYPPERSEVSGPDGVPLIPRIEIVLVRPDGSTG